MNQVQQFHEGDRISTTCPIVGLPAGSCGTVQLVYRSVVGVYDVLFEPTQTRRVVFQPELSLIAPARQAAQASNSS
jgi:hypothetical protein